MIDSSFLKVPMPRKPLNMNSYQLLHTVRFRWEFGATEDPLAGSRPTNASKKCRQWYATILGSRLWKVKPHG